MFSQWKSGKLISSCSLLGSWMLTECLINKFEKQQNTLPSFKGARYQNPAGQAPTTVCIQKTGRDVPTRQITPFARLAVHRSKLNSTKYTVLNEMSKDMAVLALPPLSVMRLEPCARFARVILACRGPRANCYEHCCTSTCALGLRE